MRPFERLLSLVSTVLGWVAGAAIFVIAVIGGIDVLSTIALGRPLAATVEATEALMVFGAFLGLGMLHQKRAYIAVDILRDHSGPLVRRLLDILALVLMALYFGLIAWRGWINAFDSLAVGEYSNGLVAIPLYPSKFALALGMSIGTLWCLLEILKGGRFRDTPARTGGEGTPDRGLDGAEL